MKLTKEYKRIDDTTYEYWDKEFNMKVVLHFRGVGERSKELEEAIINVLSREYIKSVLKELYGIDDPLL